MKGRMRKRKGEERGKEKGGRKGWTGKGKERKEGRIRYEGTTGGR